MAKAITLTLDDVSTAVDHGSTVSIVGTDSKGKRVAFAGDARPMCQVLEALVMDQEDEITVEVEPWQILGLVVSG